VAIRVIWPNRTSQVETGMRKFKRAELGQLVLERTVDKLVRIDPTGHGFRLDLDPMTARCLANTLLDMLGDEGKLRNGSEPVAR